MENEIFSTRDLYLATTLTTLGFSMESIDFQIEGERSSVVGYFNYPKTEDLLNAEKEYWSGNLSVEPRSFINNLRSLKARVNGEYKNPHSRFANLK